MVMCALLALPTVQSEWVTATSHIAGVYEVDAEGKIAAWRDYLDSRELAVQLGADESS
jgi:limonene-1,2-epoxide hydrolase